MPNYDGEQIRLILDRPNRVTITNMMSY